MIIDEKLDGRSLAKIWIDEIPNIEINVVDVLKYSAESTRKIQWYEGTIILELFFGPKPMSNYACLGVKYKKNKNSSLEIEISVSEYEGAEIKENIALTSDQVVAGIPREYAREVLKTVKYTLENMGYPNGKLEFFIGAHGYVGSSQLTFRKITEIILILAPKINILSKEEIGQIILAQVQTIK